jgi:hypothetical protein
MKLSEAMKRQFSVAKLSWAAILVLQMLAFGLAVVAVNCTAWTLPALVCGALVPISCTVLKRCAGTAYDRGEALRRLIVVGDGLGRPPSAVDLAAAATEVPGFRSLDPDPLGSYYASTKAPGPTRLADIVAESAMFTSRLARTSHTVCFLAVALGLVLGVARLIVFVARPLGTPIDAERAAQAASMVLAFGFTTEFAGLMLAYSDLATAARRSLDTCGRLAEKADAQLDDVMAAVGDYDLALSKAPPLSGIVYRLQRTFLDGAWRKISSPSNESGQ